MSPMLKYPVPILLLLSMCGGCAAPGHGFRREGEMITQRYPYALVHRAPYGEKNTFNIILITGERRRITFAGDQIVKDEIR